MHATYIDNFKEKLNCIQFLKDISEHHGDLRSPENPYGENAELDQELLRAKQEMREGWERAGYLSNGAVQWINFYAGQHYNKSYVDTFADLVNADPINTWVSTIPVGKCVPWHWDIIADYQTLRHNPKMVRYSLFLDEPQVGQIFVLKDQAFHFVEQGAVYKWHKWDEWHLGVNAGFNTKHMFHFIGIER